VRSQVRRATAVALAALAAASALRAATFAGVDVPAPLPARPVIDTYWGVSVEDPSRFLEDTADPEMQRWMRARGRDGHAAVADPGRGAYLARLQEIDAAAPAVIGDIARDDRGRSTRSARPARASSDSTGATPLTTRKCCWSRHATRST